MVLLVSHFGSALHDIFRDAVTRALDHPKGLPESSQKVKTEIRWFDLKNADGPPAAVFADLLIAAEDLKFQDMGSTARAFKDHLRVEIPRGATMNDIILGQAARHVIVHSGTVVDKKFISQIKEASRAR